MSMISYILDRIIIVTFCCTLFCIQHVTYEHTRLGFKTCFSKTKSKTKTKTKTLRFQDQDQDQDSEVPRPRPRPRLWGSRPRPRPRLVKTGLETSRDQVSSLENSKSGTYQRQEHIFPDFSDFQINRKFLRFAVGCPP